MWVGERLKNWSSIYSKESFCKFTVKEFLPSSRGRGKFSSKERNVLN